MAQRELAAATTEAMLQKEQQTQPPTGPASGPSRGPRASSGAKDDSAAPAEPAGAAPAGASDQAGARAASIAVAQQQIIELLPAVADANEISKQLDKKCLFELVVAAAAAHDPPWGQPKSLQYELLVL